MCVSQYQSLVVLGVWVPQTPPFEKKLKEIHSLTSRYQPARDRTGGTTTGALLWIRPALEHVERPGSSGWICQDLEAFGPHTCSPLIDRSVLLDPGSSIPSPKLPVCCVLFRWASHLPAGFNPCSVFGRRVKSTGLYMDSLVLSTPHVDVFSVHLYTWGCFLEVEYSCLSIVFRTWQTPTLLCFRYRIPCPSEHIGQLCRRSCIGQRGGPMPPLPREGPSGAEADGKNEWQTRFQSWRQQWKYRMAW